MRDLLDKGGSGSGWYSPSGLFMLEYVRACGVLKKEILHPTTLVSFVLEI